MLDMLAGADAAPILVSYPWPHLKFLPQYNWYVNSWYVKRTGEQTKVLLFDMENDPQEKPPVGETPASAEVRG